MAKPNRTLVEHTDDVVKAFDVLFGNPGRPAELTSHWLRFFRLSDADQAEFLRTTRLACFVHDWGKANEGFAAMLSRDGEQAVRHEVISALLLNRPEVMSWLGTIRGVDLDVVLGAVAGHHLKAADPGCAGDNPPFGAAQKGAEEVRFDLTWNHPSIRQHLAELADAFDLSTRPRGPVPERWRDGKAGAGVVDYGKERKKLCSRLDNLFDEVQAEPTGRRARLLRAIRSALIAADSAGSGLFRTHAEANEREPIHDHMGAWLELAFDPGKRMESPMIERAVIKPRLDEQGGKGRPIVWNEFQEACADPARVPARALLIAPCGSGKTLGAWRWVAARAAERPIARAIFLYPTRGTATEGFRDYVTHAGDELAALVHGTADLDLDGMQPDRDVEGRAADAAERVAEARLFALRQWPKRFFSATVDQFLAFLQHDYGSTCLLPLLADSALVLDEVHSYDRGMFTALMEFLEHFDLPVLAMTATMIDHRKRDLKRYLTEVNGLGFGGDDSQLCRIAGHPRYAVAVVDGPDAARARAEAALRAGKRVLWVVNTVDRAQALARSFANSDPTGDALQTPEGVPIYSYHSRFKLGDRRSRHEAIIKAFRTGSDNRGGVLGITTQVCEMSLDLDCDLLITEAAPITALIQRLGRCCRDQHAHEAGRVGEVVIYRPDSPHPYDKAELAGLDKFLADLAVKAVSQADLERLLEATGGPGFLEKQTAFVHDGPWACQGKNHFRDIEERTCSAILPDDEEEYRNRLKAPEKWRAQELIIPIAKGDADKEAKPPWMPSWLAFADACRHEYSPLLGYIPKAGGGHSIA
jgi:CRISPR-associated endonuclease/helicase Cas3